MKIEATTRDKYMSQLGDREQAIRQLDAFIQENAPALAPVVAVGMYGNMLGYGMMTYRPKSAKKDLQWPILMLGVQKHHMALYVCAVTKDGSYYAEVYAPRLGKVSVGKSCIRFKNADDLNMAAVRSLLVELNDRYVAREVLFAG